MDGWRNSSVLKVDIHRTNRETPGEDTRNSFREIFKAVNGISRQQVCEYFLVRGQTNAEAKVLL